MGVSWVSLGGIAWVFDKIVNRFGEPQVDLFATSTNKKCNNFLSKFSVSDALEIDALTVSWSHLNFYAFPPFAIILKILSKIKSDKAEGIVMVPNWPNQL